MLLSFRSIKYNAVIKCSLFCGQIGLKPSNNFGLCQKYIGGGLLYIFLIQLKCFNKSDIEHSISFSTRIYNALLKYIARVDFE